MKELSPKTHFLLLALLTVFLVLNPFYLHQQVNLFELGLYLPGIDGILHGAVPFRDFFYLRGPFELYVPAFLMKIFGEHVAVLSTYFYIGTVLTLLMAVLIAGELFETRIFWWIFTPLLVARTFPRVVFTYWGGLRYAWGLLAVYCAIYFLKTKNKNWLMAAGIVTAIGGLTSIEIGVSSGVAIVIAVVAEGIYIKNISNSLKSLGTFTAAALAVVLPYLGYLYVQGALATMMETIIQVTLQMTKVFIMVPRPPSNAREVMMALFDPHNPNFRHLTPAYCFMVFLIYIVWRVRRKKISSLDWAALAVAVYAFMIYATSFRNIWASVFEMSLQPEKIVLFFLLERAYLSFKKRNLEYFSRTVIVAVAASSLVFSFSHMSKRFFTLQCLGRMIPHNKHKKTAESQFTVALNMQRIKGMVVPAWQAEDFMTLKAFLDEHTRGNEPVLMFAELGALNFIVERPYVGRFATTSLSWLKDSWYRQMMEDIERAHTHYAITNKTFPEYFQSSYFLVEDNKKKFDELFSYIKNNYTVVAQTPSYNIYERK